MISKNFNLNKFKKKLTCVRNCFVIQFFSKGFEYKYIYRYI